MAEALPFIAMVQLPVEIYLGLHDGASILAVLAQQLVWAIVLLGAGRLLLRTATRKVVIQGG